MRLLFLSFLLLSTYAQAEEKSAIDNAVSITEKECEKIIRMYQFNSPNYVPGVDAHGRKVVGADLGGANPIQLPKEITFDIGIDLAEKYNLGDGFYGKANLGQVMVKGRDVYWNGHKLGQSESDATFEACQEQYGQKE